MKKPLMFAVCGLLIIALASPVFANGSPVKKSDGSIVTRISSASCQAADQTAGLLTGCLKRTFSLFNPCLDVVKGCTNLVLAPIEMPFDYMERTVQGYWGGKKAAKRVPDCKP